MALPGTVEAHAPFLSPDDAWIGFVAPDGTVKKIPRSGGAAVVVGRLEPSNFDTNVRGAHWASDGMIYIAAGYEGFQLTAG